MASISESDWKKVQNIKQNGVDLLVIAGKPLLIDDSSDEEE